MGSINSLCMDDDDDDDDDDDACKPTYLSLH